MLERPRSAQLSGSSFGRNLAHFSRSSSPIGKRSKRAQQLSLVRNNTRMVVPFGASPRSRKADVPWTIVDSSFGKQEFVVFFFGSAHRALLAR
jgi:hypothetical protein